MYSIAFWLSNDDFVGERGEGREQTYVQTCFLSATEFGARANNPRVCAKKPTVEVQVL